MPLLIILWIIVVAVGAMYGFVVGLRAFERAMRYDGEYAYSLYFLAINLCEPLINMSLILGAVMFGGFNGTPFGFLESILPDTLEKMLGPFVITSPMLVLLLPAAGLFFTDRRFRRVSLGVLRLGVLRWVINLVVFLLVALFEGAYVAVPILLILAGTVVLWVCVLWGKDQLADTLAEATTGVAQTATV